MRGYNKGVFNSRSIKCIVVIKLLDWALIIEATLKLKLID